MIKRLILILSILLFLAILASCDAAAMVDLRGYQQAMQTTAQAAGQKALEIGDWIKATEARQLLNSMRTQEAHVTATAQAFERATIAVQATEAARQAEAWQITVAAAKTSAALGVAATQDAITAAKTRTALDIAAQATAVHQQSIINDQQVARERARTDSELMMSKVWAILPAVIMACTVAVLLLVVLAWFRFRPVRRDPNGAAPILINTFQGQVINPDLQIQALLQSVNPQMPPLELAYAIAQANQRVQAVRALSAGGRAPSTRALGPAFAQPQDQPAPAGTQQIIDAEWRELDRWTGGALPLGMTQAGLLTASNSLAPHIIFAGATGSGKSRYGIRPLVTAALADGQQAILLSRSAIDFQVFRRYTNAVIREMSEPEDMIGYLDSIYREFHRRLEQMTAAGASIWEQWRGAPRLLVVADEISNLAEDMAPQDKQHLWAKARMLAREVRKAGIILVFAVQDTTARSLDPIVKRNSTRVVFHVADAEASRIFLGAPGAEALPDRHFLTNVKALVEGVAFNPSDQDITAYLDARSIRPHTPPAWLSPIIAEDAQPVDLAHAPLDNEKGLEGREYFSSDLIELAEQVWPLWQAGTSKRKIAAYLNGEYAGSFAGKIDQAIAYGERFLAEPATTTPQEAPLEVDSKA